MTKFRMGSLDHVHIMVPDRAAAGEWYAEQLGFEPVEEYRFWADGIGYGGPLTISSDGGKTTLALFQTGDGHEGHKQENGVAFSVDAEAFALFARSLPGELKDPQGKALEPNSVVDFDMCWAYNFADPWGNGFELNCYDYAAVKRDLIESDGITPTRYWPKELADKYFGS